MIQELRVSLRFTAQADASLPTDVLHQMLWEWAQDLEKIPTGIGQIEVLFASDIEIEEEAEIYGPDEE
jgi:hypothetical protein